MAPSKAISVELKARQQAILRRQLESGHYESVSEVIGDALRALDERDAAYDEFLRAKVKVSLANKRPSVPIDEAFTRARRAIARKGKAAKRGA
jgi:putative addiction module CopG family antidote